MFLKIYPFDTLFFRDGRPLVAGSDTWAEIVFPPSPSTFYGAIRSFLIFNYGTLEEFRTGKHKYKHYIGHIENRYAHYGSLAIKGIYLLKDKDNLIYFLSPRDIVKIKKIDGILYPLQFKEKPRLFISNYPLKNINAWESQEQVDDAEGWLDSATFIEYLKMNKKEFSYVQSKEIFDEEPKIGIARSRETFTSKEGYLYRIPLARFNKDISFLIEVENIDNIFPSIGVIQIGGEGKAVKFEVLSDDALNEVKSIDFQFENGYFKIYLATPAVFKNGWFPEWIDKNSLEGNYNGIKVKLVACVLGKPISIGGWDLVNQKSKPMRKAVPTGSVYYFKILNSANAGEVKAAFHYKNISDDFENIKYSKEGFGLGILGEVKL